MHAVGLHKIGVTECLVNKTFEYNGRFKLVKSVNVDCTNHQYNFGPVCEFPETYDRCFRTCFGPLYLHDAVIYGDTPNNLGKALTRLTAVREPARRGYDRQLRRNQFAFINSHRHISRLIKNSISLYCMEFKGEIEEVLHNILKPHAKKKIRLRAWAELIARNHLAHETWMNKGVTGKIKRDEFAKPEKYPRLVNDLTTQASLLGAFLTALYKHALETYPLEYKNCVIEFISTPNFNSLSDAFNKLIYLKNKMYMCYFSDDSCISIIINGRPIYFNLDISSCDASHTKHLFTFLTDIFVGRSKDLVKRVVAQCTQKLTLRHSNPKGFCKLTLKPREPVLYSGSTLTTLINNLANLLIGVSIAESRITGLDDVIAAAERVGYIVTADCCPSYHHLQFLKHSPVKNTAGDIRPLLNLGVVLRSIGRCKGIVPGRGSLIDRFKLFNGSLAQSYSTGCQHRFLHVFKTKYPAYSSHMLDIIKADRQFIIEGHDYISSDEVVKRYTNNVSEYDELCESMAEATLFHLIDVPLSRRIFLKDYNYLSTAFTPGRV